MVVAKPPRRPRRNQPNGSGDNRSCVLVLVYAVECVCVLIKDTGPCTHLLIPSKPYVDLHRTYTNVPVQVRNINTGRHETPKQTVRCA